MSFLPPDTGNAISLFAILADPEAAKQKLAELKLAADSAEAATKTATEATAVLKAAEADRNDFLDAVDTERAELAEARKNTDQARVDLEKAKQDYKDRQAQVDDRLRDLDTVIQNKENALSARENSVTAREINVQRQETEAENIRKISQDVIQGYNSKLAELRRIVF